MLDPGDVEKVIFVIIREVTFHLGGVHSPIRLGHVNRRNPQRRKMSRGMRSHASTGADDHPKHQDKHRKRPTQGVLNEVHSSGTRRTPPNQGRTPMIPPLIASLFPRGSRHYNLLVEFLNLRAKQGEHPLPFAREPVVFAGSPAARGSFLHLSQPNRSIRLRSG